MISNILTFYRERKALYNILLGVFAIILTKSIFITPFELIDGFLGVFIGILLVYSKHSFRAIQANKRSNPGPD